MQRNKVSCLSCRKEVGSLAPHLKWCGKPFDADKFWSRMEILPWSGCWVWMGCTYNAGYGSVSWHAEPNQPRKMVGTNRVAWMLTHGPIADGLDVLHECDVPLCCNPSHLRLGTHVENMQDAKRKGRNVYGEKSFHAKLTEAQVLEIMARKLAKKKARGNAALVSDLAAEYGISVGAVYCIWSGRSWTHVARTSF